MALKNAFAEIATENTLEEIRLEAINEHRMLLQDILKELKILNLHMSVMRDEELTDEDLDQGEIEQ